MVVDSKNDFPGLIRWRIVFHGFIDGYSRLITGLRASNNNRASTVLDVFLDAVSRYRVPSRVRGDHGTENLEVAAFMERFRGARRGSYIWGRQVELPRLLEKLFLLSLYCWTPRSVHNVRIERLWVDLTTTLGAKWAEFFQMLEVQYGLDPNNNHHLWLLHYLYLPEINAELDFFVETWNHHRIQIRGQPNRSPIDMFGFDMLVHGIRGDELSEEELEWYGVDWEALGEDSIYESQVLNNPMTESNSSWVGRTGPPERLSDVVVEEPNVPLPQGAIDSLYHSIQPLLQYSDPDSLAARWTQALAICSVYSQEF